MGWNSANDIFDPVARRFILLGAEDDLVTTDILTVLIAKLQDRDWDTEDESLEEFRDYPAIVEAFRRNGVVREVSPKDRITALENALHALDPEHELLR